MTKKQKNVLIRSVVSGGVLLFSYLLCRFIDLPWWAELLLFLPSYAVIGYDVIYTAVRSVLHAQLLDEKFLMMIATIGAFVVGEYPEAVLVMLFYQVGELFQSIAVGKSRASIAELMNICPETATLLCDGEERTVFPDEVSVGDILIVRSGEKIPLDGIIIKGNAQIDTSSLTGESLPVEKSVGENITSGCICLNGVLNIKVTTEFENCTVSKILELVESSSEKKAKTEKFITRFARYYTPIIVALAFLLALLPPLFLGMGSWEVWKTWLYRAMTFLVVSCPCALVISIPLSFFGGIGGAAKKGILLKGAESIENIAKVKTVVFDKTGTLTEGKFHVSAIHPHTMNKEELLDICALAESYSTHPIAESIVRAHRGHLDKTRVGEIKEIAGQGIKAVIDQKTYYIGNKKWMEKVGALCQDCLACESCHAGTVVYIACENQCLGHITVSDIVKEDSQKAISSLKRLGIEQTVMLTGDNETVAKDIAEKIGIDRYVASLLPDQKVFETEKLMGKNKKLCFVGDGINDAPVLVRSDVGIAMGVMGSDVAIESADIVLMDDKPSKISLAVRIARKTMKVVFGNIIFALGVKTITLLLTALGVTGMWLAVFADVGVCIIAILNALRCMKISEK